MRPLPVILEEATAPVADLADGMSGVNMEDTQMSGTATDDSAGEALVGTSSSSSAAAAAATAATTTTVTHSDAAGALPHGGRGRGMDVE